LPGYENHPQESIGDGRGHQPEGGSGSNCAEGFGFVPSSRA